ncbi:glycosyltransferase family 2 protein [Caenimonas sp. SL110]|uniref:glycosyltransferase family 2 protein n=1 Tax=Caenimonas sp. SL110 TaxID=1450524 RepID=UPI00065437DE|nr:glycosyltransferase family 2 protein [Caenimonas sp. SL110]
MTADANAAPELTILMPCLNEARTVVQCIHAARSFFDSRAISGEVLVADNGSSDGSRDLAIAAGARVVEVPQRGYGAALMAGIAAARGRYIVMGDADSSYDFSSLDGFLERLRAGAQLVMGNRFRGGIEPGAMPLLHRYLGNPVLSFIGRLFFRVPIGDFHCGLRGFSREAIQSLGLVTPGMEFASEMVAKSAMAGLRIEEVPTVLRPDGRGRPSHLRTWRDGWRHLRFLLLFCPRWLFFYPGLLLLGVGLAGFLVLGRGPLNFVAIGFDVHSLLYMGGATILGMQLIQLALLTKWMGVLAGLVPTPRWLDRSQSLLSVEAGLIAGAVMLLGGLAWSAGLVLDWRDSGFGALDPREMMRSAIPAVTLMVVGMQAAAGALFAGALLSCWRSGTRAP